MAENYVDAIISIATNTFDGIVDTNIVAISTHKEVLDELTARSIYFDAVCPNSKDIYIQRYINRGNNDAFVSLLQNKFESFVQDVVDSNAGIVYFTDGYFADLFYDASSYYGDISIMHNLNANVCPANYTNKIIVAVWPVNMASEIDLANRLSFNDPDAQTNNMNPLIHHVRMEFIREYFGEDLADTEIDKNYLEDCCYEYAKSLASINGYTNTSFIAVDAYPGILDKLVADSMNYILIVPKSYRKYSQYCSDLMSEEEFKSTRDKLMANCFHTVISDQFVPNCFNLTCAELSSASTRERLKANKIIEE